MGAVSGLHWTAFSKTTGKIICDLPGVDLQGQDLVMSVGQKETVNVLLHIDDTTPFDWVTGTNPDEAGIIAWTGATENPTIVGGGYVQTRVRTLELAVQIQLATPDSALDEAQVGAYVNLGANQDTIASDLITNFATGPNRPPWILTHVNPSTVTQDVNYTGTNATSVGSELQRLAQAAPQDGNGVPQPLEWFTRWQWNLTAGTIRPEFVYGSRVGLKANPTPAVTITLNDLQSLTYTEDYGTGKGANKVYAYGGAASTATSAAVLVSSAAMTSLGDKALVEFPFQPSIQTPSSADLANRAAQALAAMQNGSNSPIMVLVHNKPGKTLGVDFGIGDDMGFEFYSPTDPATGEPPLPQFATPVRGMGRVTGIRANDVTIAPILTNVVLS